MAYYDLKYEQQNAGLDRKHDVKPKKKQTWKDHKGILMQMVDKFKGPKPQRKVNK